MSETRPGPLVPAVLTAALSAPGSRGKIAVIAATVLEGRTTASAAVKDAEAQEPFSEAGVGGLAEAMRLAKEDPIVGEQERRRLTRPRDIR
jgi:hypothetical protein